MDAVKPLPIILGLPLTFFLFWVAQAAVIICQEESGQIARNRKNFKLFLFNLHPMSFVAILCPFIPFGQVAADVWSASEETKNRNKYLYTAGFAGMWITTWILAICTAADKGFGYMAGAFVVMDAMAVVALRACMRMKCNITGDLFCDAWASFVFPFALGQMVRELTVDPKVGKDDMVPGLDGYQPAQVTSNEENLKKGAEEEKRAI